MISNEIRTILKTTCKALNNHDVEYMVIGGTAVAFYGYQRVSGGQAGNLDLKYDLDFWYKPTTANFYHLLNALRELDVDTSRLEALVFDPQRTFLRIPRKSFRTEFLPHMKGLSSFDMCKKSAKATTLDGNQIYIISYEHLIENKRAVDREIDRRDIAELNKRNKKK